jgi:hypothetical protein
MSSIFKKNNSTVSTYMHIENALRNHLHFYRGKSSKSTNPNPNPTRRTTRLRLSINM